MEQELYIIRHGETDYNRKGIVQGRGVNSELNETGRWQADAFFQHYQHIQFDQVYVSQLKRTYQTVEPFLQKGLQYEALAALDEIDWGVHEGVAHGLSSNGIYSQLVEEWKQGNLDHKVDGGESPLDVYERQRPFKDMILTSKHTKVLVCSHGRAMRVLLCNLLGKDLTQMDQFVHKNLALYKLIRNNGIYEIELFNDTSHLNGKN